MADSSSNNASNSANVLQDSPWGRLSEVTSLDNVAKGFASATGDNSVGGSPAGSPSGGANSDSPYGGNPFANFGNPNASGNVFTGGTNPWASLGNSGGGGAASGQPSGGAGGAASGQTSGSVPSGGASSDGGNVGGIDFGSASQSQSFQDRVQTDNLVNNSLSDAGVNSPTSSAFGGGTTGGDISSVFGGGQGGSSVGGQGSFGGGSQGAGGFGGGQSAGGSGSGSQGAGDSSGGSDLFASVFGGSPSDVGNGNVSQVSPFDTLQTNLNNYFAPFQEGVTPDPSQFGDPSKINPFTDAVGGSQSGGGSPVGGAGGNGSDSLIAGGSGSPVGGAGGNGGDSLIAGGASGNGGSSLVADSGSSYGGGSYGDLPSGLQDVIAGLGSGNSQSSSSSDGFDPSQIPAQFGGGNQIGGIPSGGGSNPFASGGGSNPFA